MANTTLQFIKIDYQSHRDAILARIRSRWPLLWSDFSNNNLGIVLVDIIAWSMATYAFIVNRAAAENYIPTMTLRESASRIGALVGYALRGPVASTISCQAQIPNDSPSRILDITIQSGTQVKTNDGNNLVFEVAQDYLISPGETTPITPVVTISALLSTTDNIQTGGNVTNGSPYLDLQNTLIDLTQYLQPGQSVRRFDPNGAVLTALNTETYTILSLESSPGAPTYNRIVLSDNWEGDTGTFSFSVFDTRIALIQGKTVSDQYVTPSVESANYFAQLTSGPLIDGSVTVTVNDIQWTEVASLLTQTPTAQAFTVKTLATGQVIVTFGDGTFGALVPTQASVVFTYRVGGGSIGNVQIGAIDTQINGIILSLNTLVAVNVTNNTNAGQGGQDEENLEQARANIPPLLVPTGGPSRSPTTKPSPASTSVRRAARSNSPVLPYERKTPFWRVTLSWSTHGPAPLAGV